METIKVAVFIKYFEKKNYKLTSELLEVDILLTLEVFLIT